LEKICNSETKLKKVYGELAKIIMMRLVTLENSPNLEDVPHTPPCRRHKLEGIYKGMFAVDVKHPKRMILKPLNSESCNNEIELKEITSVEIVGIIDYH
jgi:proteic killer suppression protein